ncbi:MAG: iron-sulfur cluster assembly accessory protein [Halobacteria archaeon]
MALLTISESAARKIQSLLQAQGKPPTGGLRVAIIGGGCSGMQYKMSLAEVPAPGDTVVEEHGAKVLVDAKTLLFLAGSRVDYAEGLSLQGAGFKVTNPNIKSSCGCGESFSV